MGGRFLLTHKIAVSQGFAVAVKFYLTVKVLADRNRFMAQPITFAIASQLNIYTLIANHQIFVYFAYAV